MKSVEYSITPPKLAIVVGLTKGLAVSTLLVVASVRNVARGK